MNQNRLAREASPYLRQHADNPVDWYPWGPDALAEARSSGRPILLSVGYSSCHWCHVMAHESFEDPETAALMNRLFVNIKLDREERPDLDAIYQRALSLMGQHGGWPLTMFLTPEAEPFWGGTYFPPEPRWGRPSFRQVLQMVDQAYRAEPEKVHKNRDALKSALAGMGKSRPGKEITKVQINACAESLLHEIDGKHGGIGGAPKFPNPTMLELIWRNYRRTGSQLMRTAVLLTLERMSQGGIYDHLGGGYARYSTDERWLVPHFEKMLYDNALILDLLGQAWLDTENALFRRRARETVRWVMDEMLTGEGAFASALDADSEGEEGRFYVWSEAEIDAALGPDAALFKAVYDVSAEGNWEHVNILNRLRPPRLAGRLDEAALKTMRARLLAIRAQRTRPSWDDKVLADWNGLMIAALAEGSAVFAEPEWLAVARRAYHYVVHGMGEGGRLRHAARHGQVKPAEFLDDYANMARAALALHEVAGEAEFLADARRFVAILDADYWDAAEGGYFYAPNGAETVIVRTKTAHDTATPAGNGTLVGVLARLHYLTGEAAYRARAEALLKAFSGELEGNFAPVATLISNAELLMGGVQVAVIGRRGEADTDALVRAVFAIAARNRVLSVVAPDEALPAGHPALFKPQREGRATAYVCVGPSCSLPVTEAGALGAELEAACERVLG
jgi:uncharacterized protein YyaL (SSP411 family)